MRSRMGRQVHGDRTEVRGKCTETARKYMGHARRPHGSARRVRGDRWAAPRQQHSKRLRKTFGHKPHIVFSSSVREGAREIEHHTYIHVGLSKCLSVWSCDDVRKALSE